MRLALISDIHANLDALQATLADIAGQGVDRIVCLGDMVGYNTRPAECLALIRASSAVCIAGNHDLAVCGLITIDDFNAVAARAVAWTRPRLNPDELAFLRSLPLKANIEERLIAVHGALHPESGCESVYLDTDERRMLSFEALRRHPSGARICAFGHTHRAGIYELRNGTVAERPEQQMQLRDDAYYLINPGTVGEPRSRERRATYMVLDLDRGAVARRYVAYDAAAVLAAKRQAGLAPGFGAAVWNRLRAGAPELRLAAALRHALTGTSNPRSH